MTYMLVYDDGTTEIVRGDTLEYALFDVPQERQHNLVAAFKYD